MEAAEADAEAVQAAVALTRVAVIVEIGPRLRGHLRLGHQLEVARATARLQEDSLTLMERLREAGLTGALDVIRSRALLAQSRAAIPPFQSQQRVALYRLAVLERPSAAEAQLALLRLQRTFTPLDGDPHRGCRRTAAAPSRRSRCGATPGRRHRTHRDRDHGAVPAWPSTPPWGRLEPRARRRGPGADLRGQVPSSATRCPSTGWPGQGSRRPRRVPARRSPTSNRTVLGALRELEIVLDQYARELERDAELTVARDQSAEAVADSERLLAAGAVGSLDVLDAERTLADAQAALAASSGRLSSLQLSIFLALGAGGEG